MKFTKAVLSLSMVFSAVTMTKINAQGTSVDLNDKLVAYYDFENINDKTVLNKVNDTLVGTLIGSNISISDTKFGKSLHFANGEDGRMEVAQAINTSKQPFTISLWYKYDATFDRGGKKTVLLQQDGSGRTLLSLNADNRYSSYINATDVDGNKTVDLQQWQHVSFTYNPITKKLSYYVNGQLDSTKDAGNGTVDSLTKLIIGRHKNDGNDPLSMRGDIDEIRYYHKEINAIEAKAIYEDKAGVVLFDELKNAIANANNLLASDKLPATASEVVELQKVLTEAKKLTDKDSMAQISDGISKLDIAYKNYQQAIRVNLNVDLNTVERGIDGSIFGINHRYAFNGYGSFDSKTMKMKQEFADLYKESNFGSIRYPGGTISNLFQWKGTIGDVSRRTKQIHGFYNNNGQHGITPNFGLSEVGTFAQDMGSEIVYVYGFGRGSAQDAADLVEYLNAPVGLNPNGGVDWAVIRAKNGHQKPFNVRYFEIGNENNQGGTDGTASQQYWMQFVKNNPTDNAYVSAEQAYVEGGNVCITKQFAVLKDDWNKAASDSTGQANQKRYMRYANPNPMTGDGYTLDDTFKAVKEGSVEVYVDGVKWMKVDSFAGQDANAQVYTLDYRDGSFTFGNGVNGKIPPKGKEIRVSYQVKRDGFVDVSKAMKETMKKIDSAKECNIYSSFETRGFITRMNDRQEYYDGLTIHPYSGTPAGGSNNPDEFYDSAMKLGEDSGVKHVQDYVNMMPKGKVPVISEYGIFRTTDPLVRSQTHAVYIAKVLMEYVRLGSPYIQKHCLVDWYSAGGDSLGPTQQAVIQAVAQKDANTQTGEGEFKFFATPSAKVYQMINNSFGNKVIKADFDETDKLANGVSAYSSLVSKDDEGNVYVALVNVERDNVRKMRINFNGLDATNRDISIQTLAGASFTDENDLNTPNKVAIETTDFVNKTADVEVDLKPHSFTIVKISTPKTVDKTALNNELIEISKLNHADYTVESFTNLQTAVDAAKKIVVKTDATQEEVNNALANLQAARGALKSVTVDVAGLKALIARAEAYQEADYTTPSYQALQAAIAAAKVAIKDEGNALVADVEVAKKDLQIAIDNLVKAEKVDKSKLQAFYDQIQGTEVANYLPNTWTGFKDALDKADEVLGNDQATQTEVNNAYDALVKAYLDLRLKPNKDALKDLITKAQNLNNPKLTSVIAEAEAIVADENATETQVKGAYASLDVAIKGLQASDQAVATGDNNAMASMMALAGFSMAGLYLNKKRRTK